MRRKGFSLIELLIVVAIIAALVGVAVPFFQDNLQQAQQTKAKQDLDTIRNSISLHDAQNRPLVGTSLEPLVGRYLQELPKDPWGNEYLLDANVGLIISFGADNQGGGTGGDSDQFYFYKPAIQIQRAQYDGSWGVPRLNNKLILTMTKPYKTATPLAAVPNTVEAIPPDIQLAICLLTNTRDPLPMVGATVDLANLPQFTMAELILDGGTGNAANAQAWQISDTMNDPNGGILCLKNTAATGGNSQSWTPTMAMNFDIADATTLLTRFGLLEAWLPRGPLDNAVFGDIVQQSAEGGTTPGAYRRPPVPVPVFESSGSSYNRGVKLERF